MKNSSLFYIFITFFLTSCSSYQSSTFSSKNPFAGGIYKIGEPYIIKDKMFFPEEDFSYREKGIASWYGQKFHGKKTANGEIFNMNLLTAAPVSYTHLRAHETPEHLVCRLLLEKKKKKKKQKA